MSGKAAINSYLRRLDGRGSADEIAAFLERNGFKGLPASAHRCPIANYVARRTGLYASVAQSCASDGVDTWRTNYPNVRAFISLFDSGQYPNLIGRPE